jgi:hydrogenase maturation protein HypF
LNQWYDEKMSELSTKSVDMQRLRLTIRGAVQGVGFRPFIFRLANALSLKGWTCNTAGGVLAEVEGEDRLLREFLLRVAQERPAHAVIQSLEPSFLAPVGYQGFEIRHSQIDAVETWVMPEIATCAECRREILDPQDRRFRYPFTNCTHCGPRYSIVERLPYDRMNTSMKSFFMCPACEKEYQSPEDRRFHAQPNACPECGPQLQLWDVAGNVLAARDGALCQAVEEVRAGKIVALKGLGGFHVVVDAANDAAVMALRQRKRRLGKPFAMMFPDMASIKKACDVDAMEERLLGSSEAPIVLLRHRCPEGISGHVAPGNPCWGVMLPYSPLHVLLMNDYGAPLVVTSGNLAEETICTDEREALSRLAGIADLFLIHDRPIVRAVDDSVARVIHGHEQILRRARGYAPLPISLSQDLPPLLAVGGHLKNCVALSRRNQVFVSQHIGDLETPQSCDAFRRRCIRYFRDRWRATCILIIIQARWRAL